MEFLVNGPDVLSILCKERNEHGMWISFNTDEVDFRNKKPMKYAPYLSMKEHSEILIKGHGYIFCKTYDEILSYYTQTFGDDHGGNCYAITCDNKGKLMSENT